jgi:hypothetical protein
MKTWAELMALHDKYFTSYETEIECAHAKEFMEREDFDEWWVVCGESQCNNYHEEFCKAIELIESMQEMTDELETAFMRTQFRNVYYWATLKEGAEADPALPDKKMRHTIFELARTEIEKLKQKTFGSAVKTERDKLWTAANMVWIGSLGSFNDYEMVPTIKELLINAGYDWDEDFEQRHEKFLSEHEESEKEWKEQNS